MKLGKIDGILRCERLMHFSIFVKKRMDFYYNILKPSHSGLRWAVLALLIWAIINAARSMSSGKYEKKDKMVNLFTMVSLHTQFLLGLILLLTNNDGKVSYASGWMGNSLNRFFGMEHALLMIIAIVLVTIGRRKAEKKLEGTRNKHRAILISYTIGLLIILASIPWPFGPWASFGGGLG